MLKVGHQKTIPITFWFHLDLKFLSTRILRDCFIKISQQEVICIIGIKQLEETFYRNAGICIEQGIVIMLQSNYQLPL